MATLSPHSSERRRPSVVPIAIAATVAVVATVVTAAPATTVWWADVAVGGTLIGAGAVATARGRPPMVGVLVIASGAVWFVASLAVLDVDLVAQVASHLRFVPRGLLAAAAVLPLRRRWQWAAIAAVSLLTIDAGLMTSPPGMVAWSAAVVGLAASTHRRLDRSLAPAVVLAATVAGTALGLRLSLRWTLVALGYDAGIAATGVLLGRRPAGADPRQLGDTLVEIAAGPTGTVRRLLAEALGDDAADIAFAADRGWVDEAGRERAPVVAHPGRSVVDVVVGDRTVAQFVCRTDIADRPALRSALERTAVLVAENARLRARALEEAAEIEASRRRLAVSAGEQRVLLAAELEHSIGPLLDELDHRLGQLSLSDDGDAAATARVGLDRLRMLRHDVLALVSGLGPAQLVEGDLSAALRSLAATTDQPCTVDVADATDLPVEVAIALYFVAAEAVSNAVKHAGAEALSITLQAGTGEVTLLVRDDGVGGADPRHGSGLRGLADRAAAFGGELEVTSDPGAGTEVRVTLPLASTQPSAVTSPTRTHGSPK